MKVTRHSLFATRLVAMEVERTERMNEELCHLIESAPEFAAGFDMHPDSLNLLAMSGEVAAIGILRDLFLDGLKIWLETEGIRGVEGADLVLFSNYARKGEQTLVHNHNADLVGVYYARTAQWAGEAVREPAEDDDYFDPGDGLLVLHDPRFNANLAALRPRDHVKVVPRPGLMLIFPGYLWHSVTPHLGERPRLSFSMNFTLRWGGPNLAEYRGLAGSGPAEDAEGGP